MLLRIMQTLASTDIELPDILKLYACQLFYDHPIDKKSSNLLLYLVSTWSDNIITLLEVLPYFLFSINRSYNKIF